MVLFPPQESCLLSTPHFTCQISASTPFLAFSDNPSLKWVFLQSVPKAHDLNSSLVAWPHGLEPPGMFLALILGENTLTLLITFLFADPPSYPVL